MRASASALGVKGLLPLARSIAPESITPIKDLSGLSYARVAM